MMSRWTRAGAVGAMVAGAVAVGVSLAAPSRAQTEPPSTIVHPGVDTSAVVSDDGRLVVFVSTPIDPSTGPSALMLHDRTQVDVDGVMSANTVLIAGSEGAMLPSLSGDGCVVTWSALPVPVTAPVVTNPPAGDPVAGDPVVGDPGDMDPGNDGDPVVGDPVDGAPLPGGDPVDGALIAGGAAVAPLQAAGVELFALDRCANPVGAPQSLALVGPDLSFGAAAISTDGGVIAVSNGEEVIRFERQMIDGGTVIDGGAVVDGGAANDGVDNSDGFDGEYVETDRFDAADDPLADRFISSRVDVSDDGSVVVFAAGPAPADVAATSDIAEMTVFTHETIDGESTVTAVLEGADQPSMSGDANAIALVTAQGVAVVGRGDTPFDAIDLGPGRRPAISGDGNHVVIEGSSMLSIVSRSGQGVEPFETRETTALSSTIAPTFSGPAIDRLGATVVSDMPVALDAATAETDITVTVIAADAGFDAELFDLGKGDIGAELSTSVTFSNRGPASIGVASLSVDGTFRITDDGCGATIRPGTTCVVAVAFDVERLQDAFGQVALEQSGFGTEPFLTEVTALGEAPSVQPTTSVTTTTVAGTTGGSTTGGSTTGGGSSTSGTSSSTTGASTTSTSGTSTTGGITTTTTTTTTLPLGAGVVASPASFDFAPTIVDAGRRTGLVEIVNNGTRAVTVIGVRVEPVEVGAFAIVETTCAGESIAAGARCAVTLAFAPSDTGPQNVQLIASLEGGIDISVAITGTGAPAPVVAAIPGVASVGQVVTLSGSGFPTGITVELVWGATTQDVLVDDVGTFNMPVVVLANTQRGPAQASVTGQVDLFGDTVATLLVTDTSDRSGPSVLVGVGPNIGR